MIEQTIIQAALSSIETLNGTKSKFEAQTESIGNVVQISGQNTVCIAFSKLTGSPPSIVNRLKAQSSHLMWMELKRNCPCNIQLFHLMVMQPRLSSEWKEVWMSSLMNTCTVQVSSCLKYTTLQMSRILVEGLNQYAVVYGLNCRKLKNSITVHQSTQ